MGIRVGCRLSVAFICLQLVSLPALATSDEWTVQVLNRLLAQTPAGQKLVPVGDMEIQRAYLQRYRDFLVGRQRGRITPESAFDGTFPIWTSGVVPYTFSNNVSAAHQKVFLDGMAEWATFANLQFTQRVAQANYFTILDDPTLSGGQSAVGMVGDQQFLRIGSTSWNRATICHELGHTLGLIHEHQRSDRDSFVTVFTNNAIAGTELNLIKFTNSLNQAGGYDFLSVMHYARNTFSTNVNVDTIVPLPAFLQYINIMGQLFDPVLSALDRAGMAAKYGAPATPPTNVVTNTKDSGPGSLRTAMYFAFDHPGTTVTFNIPVGDPGFSNSVFNIRPTDRLPVMLNAMTIDGSTAPTNSNPNGPEILLTGNLILLPDTYANGIRMAGSNCAVRALVINAFNGSGVNIEGTNTAGNIVSGCYIGIDSTGTVAVSNRNYGVFIGLGANSNTVGGTTAAARNIISGNANQGITIDGGLTRNNVILGNYIGVNAAGSAPIPNTYSGILIDHRAPSNTIGGAVAGARNVISGNAAQGIIIFGPGCDGTIIQGNYIGLNAAGSNAVPNTYPGIEITGGSKFTLISGNVISGNNSLGINIYSNTTDGAVIQGNYIGVNAAGTAAVTNRFSGVQIAGGSRSNLIAGNVISGNDFGLILNGLNTDANTVQDNFIGTDPSGITAISNRNAGILINSGARSNTITGNLVSGNAVQGIVIGEAGTDANQVLGNHVGVSVNGLASLRNGLFGIQIYGGARSNAITGNLVSGNGSIGIIVGDPGTDGTTIQGNLIGPDATGNVALPNLADGIYLYGGAQLTRIGGTTPGTRNIISGNFGSGVYLFGLGTKNNLIQGNFIGVNTTGTAAVANGGPGVVFAGGAQTNTIGGSVGARNVISGNSDHGVILAGTNTDANVVQGNTLGLDITGTVPIGNLFAGIAIYDAARSNQVGGTAAGNANLISANGSDGVQLFDAATTNNSIRGNSIFNNTGLGIALYSTANNTQAAPVIGSAVVSNITRVVAELTSLPSRVFRIEYFASPTGDPEGKTFLGTTNVTTSAGGTITFTNSLPVTLPTGQVVTATATDPAGNTSQFSAPFTATMTDGDTDGMPDSWEIANFGNTGQSPTGDFDGDGLTNYQEYRAGTNPTSASSELRVTAVDPVGSDSRISFPSVLGFTYRVEYRDDLKTGNWNVLTDQISGTGAAIQITDPGATALPKRFYRVSIQP